MRRWHAIPLGFALALGSLAPASATNWYEQLLSLVGAERADGAAYQGEYDCGCGAAPGPMWQGARPRQRTHVGARAIYLSRAVGAGGAGGRGAHGLTRIVGTSRLDPGRYSARAKPSSAQAQQQHRECFIMRVSSALRSAPSAS